MQGLGSSKKVQDIQKRLDMSLDDLIKTAKRDGPKKAAAAGGKPKQAPKALIKPAAAKRDTKATGIAAKRMEIKARKASSIALKGIATKRAPTTLGVAKGGAKSKAAGAKGGAGVIKRAAPAKASLARRIVSRARTTKAQQQQVPKSIAAGAPKQQSKKSKTKIPAPKFTGGAAVAQRPAPKQLQQQRKATSVGARMAAQRQQQQQQQQGRRGPKQAIVAPQQQGRNLNRTAAGGVRKPIQAPKYQNQGRQQQQQQYQGQGQARRGQGQGRAPVYMAQPQQSVVGGGRGGRKQQQRQQQQQQQAYQQWMPAAAPGPMPGAGGQRRKGRSAPLSVAAPGMAMQFGFAQPMQYGQQQYMLPAQASAYPGMVTDPTTGLLMDTATGQSYMYTADASAYGIQSAWPAAQAGVDNRPAIARRNRSRS